MLRGKEEEEEEEKGWKHFCCFLLQRGLPHCRRKQQKCVMWKSSALFESFVLLAKAADVAV